MSSPNSISMGMTRVRYRKLIGKLFLRVEGPRTPSEFFWRFRWGYPKVTGTFDRIEVIR